jgi:K+ transporter
MTLTGIFMTGYSISEKLVDRRSFLRDAGLHAPHLLTLQDTSWRVLVNHYCLNPFYHYALQDRSAETLLCLQPLPLEVFLLSYNQIYNAVNKISGTALFFAKDAQEIPPYVVHTMFKNNILYEDNIIVSIVRRDDPFGVTGYFKEEIAPGLRSFEIQMGYMEPRCERS